jgi:hypothetical protein
MFLTCGDVEANVLHTFDATQGTSTQEFKHSTLEKQGLIVPLTLALCKHSERITQRRDQLSIPASLAVSSHRRLAASSSRPSLVGVAGRHL